MDRKNKNQVLMSSAKVTQFCPIGIGGTNIDTSDLKIFVGNLGPVVSSQDVYNLFRRFGQIREACVIPDRFRIRSRGYGFVTFKNRNSVAQVLEHVPFFKNGRKLTTVLATDNSKPRRAHFNVRHGTSGHKALPSVSEINARNNEAQAQAQAHARAQRHERHGCTNSDANASIVEETMVCIRTGKQVYNDQRAPSPELTVGVYSDPSLFRTANIQAISPATVHLPYGAYSNRHSLEIQKRNERNVASMLNAQKTPTKPRFPVITKIETCFDSKKQWPNEDIKKDFRVLVKFNTTPVNDRGGQSQEKEEQHQQPQELQNPSESQSEETLVEDNAGKEEKEEKEDESNGDTNTDSTLFDINCPIYIPKQYLPEYENGVQTHNENHEQRNNLNMIQNSVFVPSQCTEGAILQKPSGNFQIAHDPQTHNNNNNNNINMGLSINMNMHLNTNSNTNNNLNTNTNVNRSSIHERIASSFSDYSDCISSTYQPHPQRPDAQPRPQALPFGGHGYSSSLGSLGSLGSFGNTSMHHSFAPYAVALQSPMFSVPNNFCFFPQTKIYHEMSFRGSNNIADCNLNIYPNQTNQF